MRWQLPPDVGSGTILEQLISRRIDPSVRDVFLNPSLDHIHDSDLLHDSKAAAAAIVASIRAREKIVVHGDFDVDGVCATTIMVQALRSMGADVEGYIPSRFDEGYGISPKSLDQILAMGGQLVISVDCGVKNLAEVAEYLAQGLKFVITDHHSLPVDSETGRETVSKEALAVVHPKHPSGNYPFGEICGAMVAWKTAQAVAKELQLEDSKLFEYLDLVALATVCDVMPLVDENRVAVKFGLERMRAHPRPGIKALLDLTQVEQRKLEVYHFGFVIGPRLNAAGRLESAHKALELLLTNDLDEAANLAQELQNLNVRRQELTEQLIVAAEQQISSISKPVRIYTLLGQDWSEGIVGLAAGKLADKYNRPVLVASVNAEGVIKGSARSIEKFHISNNLRELHELLLRYGGHAQAAGFSLMSDKWEEFQSRILQLAEEQLSDEDLQKNLVIDVVTSPAELTLHLADEIIAQLSPFGSANTQPIFAILNATITDKRTMGEGGIHLKLKLGNGLEVVAFRAKPEWLSLSVGDVIDVAGTLDINEWNGTRRVQMLVKDLKLSAVSSQLSE